jgi:hypothetical protein
MKKKSLPERSYIIQLWYNNELQIMNRKLLLH